MKQRDYYTIQNSDVGKAFLRAFGRGWLVSDFIGRIMKHDVGKRVYKVWSDNGTSDVLQVENDQQFRERVLRDAHGASI